MTDFWLQAANQVGRDQGRRTSQRQHRPARLPPGTIAELEVAATMVMRCAMIVTGTVMLVRTLARWHCPILSNAIAERLDSLLHGREWHIVMDHIQRPRGETRTHLRNARDSTDTNGRIAPWLSQFKTKYRVGGMDCAACASKIETVSPSATTSSH